jgi:type IV pilus assembly protein PilC
MAQYRYKARDSQGTLHESIVSAESESSARTQITEKGLWLVELINIQKKKSSILDFELDGIFGAIMGVGLRDLVIFCRQFSSLVNSGVAMIRTLNILAEQAENPIFARILKSVKSDVEQGSSLSESFAKFPKVFDKFFISMIKAGETGGVLDEVLNRIAKFMEDKAKLSNKIKSAMAYPTLVSILATIIFFVMLTVILPKFSQIFSRLGSELPAYTQFLINISNYLRSPLLFVFIGMVFCIALGLKKVYSIKKGKYFIDNAALKVPVIGNLIKKVSVARFTRTFGTLIKSGVPILTSLEIVEESSGNAVIAKIVKNVHEEIKQGGTISAPLETSGVFPPMVVSMIAVGEETGELDAMLSKIADFYDSEVESAVDALTSMLEPLMMVMLGGMVGAVIVGMYLPMFKIFENIH